MTAPIEGIKLEHVEFDGLKMVEITAVCTYTIYNDCSCIVMLWELRCVDEYEIKQRDDNDWEKRWEKGVGR